MLDNTPQRRSFITSLGSVGSAILLAGCTSSDEGTVKSGEPSDESTEKSGGLSDEDTEKSGGLSDEDTEKSGGSLFTRVEFVKYDLVAALNEDLLEDVDDILLIRPSGEEEVANMEGSRVEHSFQDRHGAGVYYSSGEYILRAVNEFDEKIEEYSLNPELNLTVSEIGTFKDLGISANESASHNRIGVVLKNEGGIPVSASSVNLDTSDSKLPRIIDNQLSVAASLGEEMTVKLPAFDFDGAYDNSTRDSVEEKRGEYETEIVIGTGGDEKVRIPITIELKGDLKVDGEYYFSETNIMVRK